MIKEFLMRQMLKRQLKDMPQDQQEQLIEMVTKNPDFFQKIALEIQEKTNGGMDQMAATMAVMKNHQSELQGLMKKDK